MQAQNAKVQDQLAVAVNRVLGKHKAAAYKKMLGAPMDFSQALGGPGRGPGNRPAGAKPPRSSRFRRQGQGIRFGRGRGRDVQVNLQIQGLRRERQGQAEEPAAAARAG